jgi:hypothetical protein
VSLGGVMTSILTWLDRVNAADVNFLLGTWVADAQGTGTGPGTPQTDNRVVNALNQITLWGPEGACGRTEGRGCRRARVRARVRVPAHIPAAVW